MQIIHCETFESFMDCVEALTKKGLTFKAKADTYSIELTGGY